MGNYTSVTIIHVFAKDFIEENITYSSNPYWSTPSTANIHMFFTLALLFQRALTSVIDTSDDVLYTPKFMVCIM